MRKDRLLKLAAFLETVPRKAFTISVWQARKATKPEGERPGDCGFAGCAVGWAAHAKLFRGFSLRDDNFMSTPCYRPPGKRAILRSGEAISTLFDLPWRDCVNLFMPTYYPGCRATPKQVARKIRKLVKDHQSP